MEKYKFNIFPEIGELAGIKHGFLLILIYALISLIIVAPIQLVLANFFPDSDGWIMLIAFVLSFGLLLPVGMRIWNSYTFEQGEIPVKDYIIMIPGIFALSIVVEGMVSLIPMPDSVMEYFARMVQMNLPGFLTVAIAAPILEELIFRGVILKGFLKKYEPQKAILWSAAIFGVAHLNPWQFVAAFSIGIVIGYMYWKTQSIWPGIFIHFINNSFSFYLGYKAGDINISFAEFVGGYSNYFMLLGISIAICYFVGKYFLNKYNNKISLNYER